MTTTLMLGSGAVFRTENDYEQLRAAKAAGAVVEVELTDGGRTTIEMGAVAALTEAAKNAVERATFGFAAALEAI